MGTFRSVSPAPAATVVLIIAPITMAAVGSFGAPGPMTAASSVLPLAPALSAPQTMAAMMPVIAIITNSTAPIQVSLWVNEFVLEVFGILKSEHVRFAKVRVSFDRDPKLRQAAYHHVGWLLLHLIEVLDLLLKCSSESFILGQGCPHEEDKEKNDAND